MSGFLNKNETVADPFDQEINFEDAVRMPDGGSTCEIYRTRWHRREVFVKRLKDEFRSNPLYLDALDKEYEIGVSLKHPCLPDYRMINRDYIVMDYIDGDTLADMIKRKDPWLSNEKNIVRVLRDLVEATGYLHRHNVTHCDIKTDNIMITSNNRNVVLIDLDKCYTDAFNDTAGNPSLYGLTEKDAGRIAIDFHGLGIVAQKLKERIPGFKFRKYRKFIELCHDKDCSVEELLEILDYKPSPANSRYNPAIIMISIFILIGLLTFWFFYSGREEKNNKITEMSQIVIPYDSIDVFLYSRSDKPKVKEQSNGINTIVPAKTQEQIHDQAQAMAANLDKRIQPYYDELNTEIDSLVSFSNKPDITGGQLLEKLRKHGDKEDEYIHETFSILEETFPNLTERETWRVMAYSKAYTQYKRRAEPILGELGMKVKELGNYEYLLESK